VVAAPNPAKVISVKLSSQGPDLVRTGPFTTPKPLKGMEGQAETRRSWVQSQEVGRREQRAVGKVPKGVQAAFPCHYAET
jgi:hypothetical protein